MNVDSITLKKLNSILIEEDIYGLSAETSLSLVSEFIALGYMPTNKLISLLELASQCSLDYIHKNILPLLQKSIGANVKHRPLFPNFPKEIGTYDQVANVANAIKLYNDTGEWDPDLEMPARKVQWEEVKFRKIDAASYTQFNAIITNILRSADSISEGDRAIIKWFMEVGRPILLPDVIPFKENVCVVAAELLKQGKWKTDLVKTPNDVLRIATYLSDGDISLAENTKFKNLPRKYRKHLVQALEAVSKDEDFVQHKGKWVKLGHSLHVGDYSKPLWNTFKKLRENIKIETFNGQLESNIANKEWGKTLTQLCRRPGVFARKLGQLLTGDDDIPYIHIIDAFDHVIDKIPTRNLTQLWGSMKTRYNPVHNRMVMPKGSVAKAYMLRNELPAIPAEHVNKVIDIIKHSLRKRFADLPSLGKVYLDTVLNDCPLPTGQRSASEGLIQVARGTRMNIGKKKVLRFFCYWKGQDIDLSASFHDEDFNHVGEIAFYNLKEGEACHSGDITSAMIPIKPKIEILLKQNPILIDKVTGMNFENVEGMFNYLMSIK